MRFPSCRIPRRMRIPIAILTAAFAAASSAPSVRSGETGQAASPEGLAPAEWSGIRAAHEAWRHRFHQEEDGTHIARNPGQQWTTRFDGRGFLAEPSGQGWRWGLELRSYGVGEERVAVSGEARAEVSGDGGRLSYHWDGHLEEWFLNDVRGLEQGWTLRERPAGAVDQTLRLDLAVRGGLRPAVSGDGLGVGFAGADGGSALTYGGLKAWDAEGRELPARFLAGEEAGSIAVEVDERGAVYPVTIDPLAQQAYLKADNADAGDQFGTSVAVSGDTAVVGAPFEDSSATDVDGEDNDFATDAGAAYVFVRNGTTWVQQAYLKADNTGAGDQFGTSVAISDDTVVVGAPQEDSNAMGVDGDGSNNSASASGAAYVFVRDGTEWSQQAYLKASNTGTSHQFGFSVAVSDDTVVAGAYGESSSTTGVDSVPDNLAGNAGAAYVFVRDEAEWSQQAYLKAHNTGAVDLFGRSVGVSGDTVVVGAPQEAGSATGVDGEDNDDAPLAGAAYVFVRSGAEWSQQAYLKAHNTGANDRFGYSVAVSDGTAVVGAPVESSSATGVDSADNNDASGSGAAYVFVHDGTEWSQQAYLKASNTGASDEFGSSVAVSGGTAVVGAPYEDSGTTGGNSAPNESASNAGAAYVFVLDGAEWSQQAYLKAHNAGAGDLFGYSVSVSDGTVVGGAPMEDGSSTGVNGADNDAAGNAGAACIFVVGYSSPSSAAPTLKSKGKKTVRTKKARHTVKGSAADADGDLLRVEAKDTRPSGKRKFRKAKGTAKWSYKAPLKAGRNKIQVRAVDATGKRSKAAKITVIRQR